LANDFSSFILIHPPNTPAIKRKEEEGWSVRRLEVDKGRGLREVAIAGGENER